MIVRRGRKEASRWQFCAVAVLTVASLSTSAMGQRAFTFDDIAPRIVELASVEPGFSEAQQRLMEQVSSLGQAAIHRVLPLLKHEDPPVRDLTTRILCHTYRLNEENLDALIEAKHAGNEAIAIAIAKIGTPSAIAFLVEELKREKHAETQTYWALYRLGEDSVPSLVQLIESEPLDDELAATLVELFGDLRDKAEPAVNRLTAIVAAGRDAGTVECAVLALGAIGEKARGSVPVLQKLAESDPAYKDVVDRSLQAMNRRETVVDVIQHLGAFPDGVSDLSELTKWGEQGDSLALLIEFISGRQGNEIAIGWAVWLLGEIGPKARQAAPLLLELAQENLQSYQNVVDRALLQMGVPEAAPGAMRMLDARPDQFFILDIVRLGELGKPAGQALVCCLEREDWDLRLDAARAIGYIGYDEGVPHLIKLLDEKDDWRLAFVAATSLGRLRATQAVGPLTELSGSHWYPPVRDAAKKAILAINGQAAYPVDSRDNFQFRFEYDEYMLVTAPSVPLNASVSTATEPDRLDVAQLAKLAYDEQYCCSETDEDDRSVEKWYTVNRVPQVGIRVDDGYLVGFNQGEFGGELLFIDTAGKRTSLWENTQGIHKMPFGIVAVTGYGHFTNRGMLVNVVRGQDGAWQATRFKSLPGCPRRSAMLANGNLRIDCGSNGCVELTPSGDLKMAGSGT